LETGQGG